MSEEIIDIRGIGKNAGVVVAVFGLVGFGLGFSGLLTILSIKGQFSGGAESSVGQLFVGVVFLQNVYTTFLLGSVVAAFTGLVVGYTADDQFSAAIGGGVGSAIGFYVMAVITLVLMLLALGGAGGQSDIGGLVLPFLGAGIPAAIVGLTTAYTGTLLQMDGLPIA